MRPYSSVNNSQALEYLLSRLRHKAEPSEWAPSRVAAVIESNASPALKEELNWLSAAEPDYRLLSVEAASPCTLSTFVLEMLSRLGLERHHHGSRYQMLTLLVQTLISNKIRLLVIENSDSIRSCRRPLYEFRAFLDMVLEAGIIVLLVSTHGIDDDLRSGQLPKIKESFRLKLVTPETGSGLIDF